MRRRIAVAGAVAQKPAQGGHTWVFLQYLLGLRRLGWDVLFIDRLAAEACVDTRGERCAPADSVPVRYLRAVMERVGLGDAYALFVEPGEDGGAEQVIGRDRRAVFAFLREAELLLNVMGFLEDPDLLAAARRRVFLDLDPGFPQMWRELGLADVFAGHDAFVTVGGNLGRPGCTVPDCGLEWIPTVPPVVLERWPPGPPVDGPFTSVATWRGRWAPVDFGGERYGLRAHELRKFAALPRRSGAAFELALAIDEADAADRQLLAGNGWRIVPPAAVAGDPWAYQEYLERSLGEFMVAKDMYVRSRSGWLSDRSACYLAAGRPAVVQDTGLDWTLPLGEGLLAYRTFDEACAAVEEVASDPLRHARAARRVAEEVFDSDVVLARLLERLGASS